MTENTSTDTPAAEADTTTQVDTAPQDQPQDQDQTGGKSGNAEAAKYRKALRTTESERDALAERVGTMQRAEAERLAADRLADGADLWRDGADLAALLDDAGNLDPGKVTELATEIAAAHPHWRKGRPNLNAAGMKSGAAGQAEHRPQNWSTVLRSGAR